MKEAVYDFHTHSFLSDGVLSPLELVRRALVAGYRAIAIADHVGLGYLERLIGEVTRDCALAEAYWDIAAIPGVELTHLPPQAIAEVAGRAKEMGAPLVVVHGESTAEPVHPGTNLAAVSSSHVDILAHPGLLTLEEARLAAANGVFLEVTAKIQHSGANRRVVEMARLAGAKLIVNSDAHNEGELLSPSSACTLARDAGLGDDEIYEVLELNPRTLLERVGKR